ncbi:bifunctional 2-polyprenyl-6-hydroxyphenol methylase/3-demethylubiquinol 3-O-methyltransferase UbiG [Tersicoccus sp. Bi-70]|uniref:class I SAM-dependent methyltransferase n=1 Tax=Tersicoccus sp. Bi-70 TaxID=1897634 RepID=UPI000977462D|nr:class I SAM-dependent methyltransferase [Tersicoccus sp. Bi-70]OMH36986.1 ubiquinone biosynthesis protein [Tersicoccus sp. Bi-70]
MERTDDDDAADDAVRRAYDTVADAYADAFTSTEPELPVDLAMIEHFVSLLAEPRDVLDAGCGAGRMMPLLAGLGCRVQGVDLSPGMIQRAQRDHGQFPSRVAALTDLPLPDGVLSWYSTIHTPDGELPGVLTELRRVLRPGGHILLAFQSGKGVTDVSPAYRDRGHDVTLRRHNRSADRVAAELRTVGMEKVALLERAAASHERTAQAVVIALRPA